MIENKKLWIYSLTFLLTIIDILSKYLMFSNNNLINNSYLFLNPVKNYGSAFGIFSSISFYPYIVLLLSFIIITYIIYNSNNFIEKNWLLKGFFIMFLAGILGNSYDRIFLGYVRDFINIPYFAVINLADIYLSIAVILILIEFIRDSKKIHFSKIKQNFKNTKYKIKYRNG